MARPREFDPDTALEQAIALFWEKGYSDTSYEDIVNTTQVSRYGLYDVFGNKRDLFRAALAHYMERFRNEFQADLRRPEAALPEIRGYFESLLELGATEAAKRGCLVCNTAIEMARSDREVAADVQAFFEEMFGVFRNALKNAKRRKQVNPALDIENWAVSLTALNQSSSLMLRLGFGLKTIRRSVEASLSALEGEAEKNLLITEHTF